MAIKVDRELCPHDHVCPLIKICPQSAILQGGDLYPIVDENLCVACGQCVEACPKYAMKFED